MKKINSLVTSFLILLFLNSCGTISEGLGGSKKKGSDEFLVEKKSPLVLPPSFGELPEPQKNTKSGIKDTSDIEDIINQTSSSSKSKNKNDTKSSIEESIIKKINEKKITEKNLDENIKKENEKPKKKKFF